MTSEPDSQEAGLPGLPEAPVDRLVGPIARFLHVEAASGVVLLAATLAALCLANSPLGPGFLALLPEGVDWSALVGGGLLAGIGFTMALFIAGLALEGPLLDARSRAPCSTPARGPPARRPLEGPLLDAAKVGILGASAACGAAGMLLLRSRLPAPGADAPASAPRLVAPGGGVYPPRLGRSS